MLTKSREKDRQMIVDKSRNTEVINLLNKQSWKR